MKTRAISLEKAAYVMFYSIHKFLFAFSQKVEASLEDMIAKFYSLCVWEILCVWPNPLSMLPLKASSRKEGDSRLLLNEWLENNFHTN